MSRTGQSILLVEGESDKYFFQTLCKHALVNVNVVVAPPKDLGGKANNKEGALCTIPTMIKQMADGRISRLAVIVDADHESADGLGAIRTIDRINQILSDCRYTLGSARGRALLFNSMDGLPVVGAWVMPDNASDGCLEDFISANVHPNEIPLFQIAKARVGELESPKFKRTHVVKAEVATWLAWQRCPGRGSRFVLEEEQLFNSNSLHFTAIADWLRRVFN